MKRPAALVALVLLAAAPLASADMQGSDDPYHQFRTLTREESVKVLNNFRNYRAPADQRLRFVIKHSERHADEDTVYTGELCATWTATGMITRVDIRPEGKPEAARRSFLLVNGAVPALYASGPGGKALRIDAEALKPMLPGLVFTPYDLQLPFIHWPEFKYIETERFRTRPTDYFRMSPTAEFKKTAPEIASVKLGFDRAYNALMRAETVDSDGKTLRDLRAESFGKIQDKWIISAMSLRDGKTRDSDKLEVRSAATGLKLPDAVFSPENLGDALPSTPDSAFSKVD